MKRFLRTSLVCIVLLSGVLLAYKPLSETTYPLVGDEYVHIALGKYILDEGRLPFENPYLVGNTVHANFESGFHVLLAGLFTVFGDDPIIYYNNFAILFLVINSLLIFSLTRAWTGSFYAALFAMFFFETIKSVGGFLVHPYFLPLTVGVTLLLLAHIFLHRYEIQQQTSSVVVLIVLLALMAIIYPPALFFFLGTCLLYLLSLDHTLHTRIGISKKQFLFYVLGATTLLATLLCIFLYALKLETHALFSISWDIVHIRLSPLFHFGLIGSAFAILGLTYIVRNQKTCGRILLYWLFFGLACIYLFNVFNVSLLLPFPRLFLFYLIGISIAAGIGFAGIVQRICGVPAKRWRKGIATFLVFLVMSVQITYAFRGSVEHTPIMTDQIYSALLSLKQTYNTGLVIADGVVSLGVYPAIGHHVLGLISSNIGGGNTPEVTKFLRGSCEEKLVSLYRLRDYIGTATQPIPPVHVLSHTPQQCDFLEPITEDTVYVYKISEDVVAEALKTWSVFLRELAPVPPKDITKPTAYTLSEEELREVIMGSTVTSDTWSEYYDPSGALVGYFTTTSEQLGYRGFWKIRGNAICTHFLDDSGFCMTVSVTGTSISFYNMDGSLRTTGVLRKGKDGVFENLY